MKRRDFLKTSLCMGCVGALGSLALLCKKEGISSFSDIELLLRERNFLYKNTSELPKRIRLDICNQCQLNCAACWIRKNEENIKRYFGGFGFVSFKTFKDFIDRHEFIEEIELSNAGEIFLNPELEDIIKYSHEKGITLSANSGVNLNSISEEMAEILVKYKFKAMNVSIDGATPEVYSIYRRGGDFNKVIHNIKMINKYKEKYNSPYPIMVYKYILFGHNIHQIEQAKVLAKSLNMPVWFVVNMVKDYSQFKPEDLDTVNETAMFYKNTLDMDSDTQVFNYQNGKQNFGFCTDLYEKPQFNWNGDFFGCSTPYNKTFGLNVFEDGMLKVLNNEKVLYTKLLLTDFNVKPTNESICYGCSIYGKLKQYNLPINKNHKDILKI